MTILSAQSIRNRKIITPFHERSVYQGFSFGLSPAGYDIRIAESVYLDPGTSGLGWSLEHFDMPNDLLGRVCDKSSWARRFLAVQTTLIEPGWRGFLTLELSNHGTRGLQIDAGMPIAQIIFDVLDEPTEAPYRGKYQDQEPGAWPARYERGVMLKPRPA